MKKSADLASNTRILVKIVQLCIQAHDWKTLGERVTLLSKKHGILKAVSGQSFFFYILPKLTAHLLEYSRPFLK